MDESDYDDSFAQNDVSQETSILVPNEQDIYNSKEEVKANENEVQSSLSSEEISKLLAADFQRYAPNVDPTLQCPIDICFDSEDMQMNAKYETYVDFLFPTSKANNVQNENAYDWKKFDYVKYDEYDDSYAIVDLDFDEFYVNDSCVHQNTDYSLKESERSTCVFLDLPMANELISNAPFSDLEDACKSSGQQVISGLMQSNVCVKEFHPSL